MTLVTTAASVLYAMEVCHDKQPTMSTCSDAITVEVTKNVMLDVQEDKWRTDSNVMKRVFVDTTTGPHSVFMFWRHMKNSSLQISKEDL